MELCALHRVAVAKVLDETEGRGQPVDRRGKVPVGDVGKHGIDGNRAILQHGKTIRPVGFSINGERALLAGIWLALNKNSRIAAASIGGLMTVLTFFLYLVELILARSAPEMNEALNYLRTRCFTQRAKWRRASRSSERTNSRFATSVR